MVIAVDAYKLAYMALPKAGCSSVKEALARLDPAVTVPPEDRIDAHTWHEIYPTVRFRPHRFEDYDDYWRFCVVRDPVKRLMSCYTNRVQQFRDVWNSRKVKNGRDWLPDLSRDPDPDVFFRNLDAYRLASSSIKHHSIGAWLFLGKDLGRYHRVYKTEEFDALAWDLGLLTRRQVSIPRRNSSERRLTLDDLKPATIDAIRPFLEQEYEYLSGFYENPLGPRLHEACVTPIRDVS